MNGEYRERLALWEQMPYPQSDYPPGSSRGTVDGVDLALLDGDAAALLHGSPAGELSDQERTNLAYCLASLRRVLPALSPAGQAYFGPALDLLTELESTGVDR